MLLNRSDSLTRRIPFLVLPDSSAGCVEAEAQQEQVLSLTAEGEGMVEHGSHEARVFNAVPKDGIAQSQLMVQPISKLDLSRSTV